ncbi:MAG: AIR synthase-related protein [Patescibacteria group bacterium]|nr:AIR synthase-related protein [Patescibacteria group bacterium]
MLHRIAVAPKIPDARAGNYLRHLQSVFPSSGLRAAFVVQAYTVSAKLSEEELKLVAEALTNPLTEHFSLDTVPAPSSYTHVIEIGYLPGVTDNVGHTARETIEDKTDRAFKAGEAVYSSFYIFLDGDIDGAEAERMASEIHNPLIERAHIYPRGAELPIIAPRVELHGSIAAETVDLQMSDEELERIGLEGISGSNGVPRGPLALSLKQMKVIRKYFEKEGRSPTDIELEALAQTWSEHCKHTIFSDPLDEIKEGIYRRYIKGATAKIREQQTENRKQKTDDFCVSVFKDNSGAIRFDDEYLVTHKVETHNAPSALDPFGGSVTAIGGVNRDCLGFGLGAKPIANTYGFCVGEPNDERVLYRDPPSPKASEGQGKERKHPMLSPRRILEGVVKGINVGGNQSGIPTPLGFVAVDDSFRGKPLVFGGTVGLIPRKSPAGSRGRPRKLYEKRAKVGDYIIMLGGRVGLDGIHGATFSSESLSKGSPATAVQIGDPITQKKFADALIREARDQGLYNSITDNGAGGLSGSVGEMARESGGCEVDIKKVPLKYPGLAPWQIWISESQERMTLAVPKSKWPAFKKICERHGVEATRIGNFTRSGRCVVRYDRKKVMDVKLDFLHEGRPIEKRKSKKPGSSGQRTVYGKRGAADAGRLQADVLKLLARPNVGSISFISQQYDHEVQGTSVTKPLHGKGRVNADAGVMRPVHGSHKGIVLSHGYCPWYSQIDTYAMAAAAIDTAVRNAVCAGASLDPKEGGLAILDNFCWSSSEKPERLYELKQAAKACYDTAVRYGTPFISGKDSMHNDFKGFDADGKPVHIAALPTLLISAIGVIHDVAQAMTIDLKRAGDALYLVGETRDEMGASEYLAMLRVAGGEVPAVDTKKNAKAYRALAKAIRSGLVASAASVGRGGLAVALARGCIAGQMGASVDVSKIPGSAKQAESILFSESQGRVLVSVREGNEKGFERLCKGLHFARIGQAGGENLSIKLPDQRLELSIPALSDSYNSYFKNW